MGGRASKPSSSDATSITTQPSPLAPTAPSPPPDSSSSSSSSQHVHVGPSDVVIIGCGVVTAAAIMSGVATYRSGSKSLIQDGINPSNRLRMIPVAVQTLMLSTLFTGLLGVGGFYALRAAGLFSQDVAELPSAAEAARMIKGPRAYIKEAISKEKQQQQQDATLKPAG